jgi:predicted permease
VAVIGDRTWRQRFGSDPDVVGRVIRVGALPVTIVGITPPGFFGVSPGRAPEITVPVTLAPRLQAGDADVLEHPAMAWLHFMGRLEPGRTIEAAQAEFQVIWEQALEATTPLALPQDRRARFLSRRTGLEQGATGFSAVRNRYRQPLLVVTGFAVLLLVITCGSATNMLLAASWGRSHELAIRMTLGCGRRRLARQLLIEGTVLASLASLAALAIVPAAGELVVGIVTTSQSPVVLDLAVDVRLLLFALGLLSMVALTFSLAPVLVAVRLDADSALRAGSRQVATPDRWIGRGLVAAQAACAVLLLVAATLFLRSLGYVLAVEPGFDPEQLLIARLPAAENLRDVVERIDSAREVQSSTVSLYPPISDEDGAWTQSVGVDGAPPVEESRRTFFNAVSPGFFTTLGTPLVGGRDFLWSDAAGSQHVVILNRAAAERFFGTDSPIGRRITVGLDASRRDLTVIGVVGNTRYQRLQEAQRDIVFVPLLQAPEAANGELFATVRVPVVSEGVVRTVREAAASNGDTARVERLTDRIRESLVTERALAFVALALALSASLLAGASVFGLMAHSVARRAREIGVRVALGARASQILRQVVLQASAIAIGGIAAGLAAAWASMRWIGGLLHGVSASDTATYLAAAVAMLAIAVVAALVPAHRAASVDPMAALRAE